MRRRVCAVAAGAAVVLTAGPGGAVADGAPPGEEPDVAVVVHAAGRTASWHAGRRDFDRLRSLPDPLREGDGAGPGAVDGGAASAGAGHRAVGADRGRGPAANA